MRRTVFALACVVVVGCGNPPIVVMDSGPRDTGMMGTDTPMARPDTGGPGCPPAMGPAPTAAACAGSTLTCLMTATTAMAQQACLMADPNPTGCNTCINQDIIASCTTGGTCADEYGLIQCCVADACPAMDMACVTAATGMGGACATEVNDAIMCFNADQMAMRCGVSNVCFM